MCQYLAKMDYFEFFCLNLGKLYNYMRYFGSNNAFNGVAESWVVTEMSWVELDGAGWTLKRSWWRWMEVDGGGWRWVHGLVMPIKKIENDRTFIKHMMIIMQT